MLRPCILLSVLAENCVPIQSPCPSFKVSQSRELKSQLRSAPTACFCFQDALAKLILGTTPYSWLLLVVPNGYVRTPKGLAHTPAAETLSQT